MGLRLKFNLVLLVGLVAGLSLASFISYRLVFATAREHVLAEAALMSAQADAISQYTVQEIAPLLEGQLARRFLPQSIPAWAAQTNFRTVQKSMPDYSFRTVMLNPTNPADLANDWQNDVIGSMRKNADLKEVILERDGSNGPILTMARPLAIRDPACLACHSTPEAAPATVTDLYGTKNGFNWQLNEVLGARIVSVPMALPLARAWDTFTGVVVWLGVVFFVVLVLMNLMLHYVIIRPVRRIAASANEVSLGNMDAPEITVSGRDEISTLGEAFNRMRRSLANAMKMLES